MPEFSKFLTTIALSALGSMAQASTVPSILLADQGADQILFAHDLNNDGDANDTGESHVFFDAGNASGLANPTGSVFTLSQADDGSVYIGDGSSDTVYRLRDTDGDNAAQSAGEAGVWFSKDNAAGFALHTPNGLAQGNDGAIYVIEADVRSDQSGDYVFRTQDLNNDGDANDAGEATVWLDLKALNPLSSAFEISFDGDTAYIADTAGTDTNVIYRARDTNADGVVSTDEVTRFIDGDNTLDVPVDFAMDARDGSVYLWEFLDVSGVQSLFKLTDLDGSGSIDAVIEADEIWNTSYLPDGLTSFAAFAVAATEGGDIYLTSNASDAEGDNLFRLSDLNGDGDYLDAGETIGFLSRSVQGALPERARGVAGYTPIAPAVVPLPAGLPLLGAALFSIFGLRRRQTSI